MSDLIRGLARKLGSAPPVSPKNYDPNGAVIIAGHESPHKFDQYSLNNMGDGQGAQSFGRGIYLWEDPIVGSNYNQQFKRPAWDQDTFFKPPEKEIAHHFETGDWAATLKILENLYETGRIPAEISRLRASGNVQAAGAALEDWARRQLIDRYGGEREARRNLEVYLDSDEHRERDAIAQLAGWLEDDGPPYRAKDWLNPPGGVPGSPGFTYQTHIHADRADLPDYRLPFGKQPRHLREPLRNVVVGLIDQIDGQSLSSKVDFNRRNELLDRSAFRRPFKDLTVQDLRDAAAADIAMARQTRRQPLLQPSGRNHPALGVAESAMLDEGIPGVRYSANRGISKTENFVIFDPKHLEIVKRYPYSIAGPLLAPAITSPADTDRR